MQNDECRMRRAAFTLVDSVISVVIASLVIVAAMRAARSAVWVQYKAAERATARMLADGLMAEIMVLSYEDPSLPPVFGRESNETATSRSNYDDVDDYNGWSQSPPQDKDGNTIPGANGWSRSAVIEWVNAADPTTVSAAETGAKRITITVKRNGVTVLTRVGVRTKAP
jgi:MSHA pilin protein MshD